MVGKKGEKTLTYHSGSADNTAFFLFCNNKAHYISPLGIDVEKNNINDTTFG
jgi:hypothetical protein